MKTNYIITIVLIFTFSGLKYHTNEIQESLELNYIDEDGFSKFKIKRTIVSDIYTDTTFLNDGKFFVEIFKVKNGEWVKIKKDKELPYFSVTGILNDEYIITYDRDERNKLKLVNPKYTFMGLKSFETDWYYSDNGDEYKIGQMVFNEYLGPVIYKYPQNKEIRLEKIIKIY